MGEAKRNKQKIFTSKPSSSKSSVTTIIIIVAIIAVIGYDFYSRNQSAPLTKFDPARTKGVVDAPLQILEFVDFQCYQCAQGAKVLKEYFDRRPGNIRVSMKYFPLGQLNSTVSAVYAQCASEQGKFWEYHDLLFERQDEWRTLLKVRPVLKSLATEAGLDVVALEKCSEGKKAQALVESDKAIGESHFVKSTPTYFVNGEMFVGVESLKIKLKDFFEFL